MQKKKKILMPIYKKILITTPKLDAPQKQTIKEKRHFLCS